MRGTSVWKRIFYEKCALGLIRMSARDRLLISSVFEYNGIPYRMRFFAPLPDNSAQFVDVRGIITRAQWGEDPLTRTYVLPYASKKAMFEPNADVVPRLVKLSPREEVEELQDLYDRRIIGEDTLTLLLGHMTLEPPAPPPSPISRPVKNYKRRHWQQLSSNVQSKKNL